MEQPISRSEKKRRAKNLENLAEELVNLPKVNIRGLPCDDFLKNEISRTTKLKGGARKRQVKYITKNLRQMNPEPLLDFLANQKGSQLKKVGIFHDLERLRDDILAEAFDRQRDARKNDKTFTSDWPSKMTVIAVQKYPSLDEQVLKEAATKFAITTRHTFKRELFKILKSGQDKSNYV